MSSEGQARARDNAVILRTLSKRPPRASLMACSPTFFCILDNCPVVFYQIHGLADVFIQPLKNSVLHAVPIFWP